jgi:hypothetical protein
MLKNLAKFSNYLSNLCTNISGIKQIVYLPQIFSILSLFVSFISFTSNSSCLTKYRSYLLRFICSCKCILKLQSNRNADVSDKFFFCRYSALKTFYGRNCWPCLNKLECLPLPFTSPILVLYLHAR